MKIWIGKCTTSAISSAAKLVKCTDAFGVKVNLNYKGREKFSTFVGGLATIVMIGFLLQYFYNQLANMVLRESTVVNSGNKINCFHLISTLECMKLENKNFIFGFKEYRGVSLIDPTYFSTKVYQVREYSDVQGQSTTRTNTTEIPLTYCGDRFRFVLSSPAYENMQISQFYCMNSTDYTIGGNVMSQERDKIQISISKCTGLPTCRTDAEINNVLNSMYVGFAISDYFFDIDDYTSPLKVNARNDITFIPTSGFTKVINIKVRTNIVEDQPSPYPFSNSQSYEYYSIGEIVREVALSQNGQIFQIVFSLDNEYLQMSRSVYSLADMIGQVGGFGGMLISIFSFVVGVISTKVYQQSIMSDIYIYQVNSNDDNSKRTTSNRIFPEEIKVDHSKKRSISFHTEYNLKMNDVSEVNVEMESSLNKLKTAVLSRKEFKFAWTPILLSIFCCPRLCCRQIKSKINSK